MLRPLYIWPDLSIISSCQKWGTTIHPPSLQKDSRYNGIDTTGELTSIICKPMLIKVCLCINTWKEACSADCFIYLQHAKRCHWFLSCSFPTWGRLKRGFYQFVLLILTPLGNYMRSPSPRLTTTSPGFVVENNLSVPLLPRPQGGETELRIVCRMKVLST